MLDIVKRTTDMESEQKGRGIAVKRRFVFALLLALLAALFVVGPTALADDPEEEYLDVQAVDVTLDEEFTVNVPADTGEFAFVRFTPDKDGFYTFSSTVENEEDPMDWLYYCCFKDHVNKNRDNWFRGAYHRDEIQLEAGNTYYFSLSRAYEGGSGSVNLKLSMHKGLVRADAIGETSLSVAPNGTVPLQVNVQTNDEETELTYRWNATYGYYDDNGDWQWESKSFNEATGPSLITDPITHNIQYDCHIDDGELDYTVAWYITVENHLALKRVSDCDEYGNVANVTYNEPVTLEVAGTCDGGDIQYQWYQWKETDEGTFWVSIEGATGTSCTTEPVVSNAEYKVVARDVYGSETELPFYVGVESEVQADYAEGQQYNMTVPVDEPVTLQVLATSSIDAGLTYQWYWAFMVYDEDEDLWEWTQDEKIEGATDSEYTVEQITGPVRYYCEVSDGFDRDSLSFNLNPETSLQATVKDSEDDYARIEVPLNQTATLEVDASCEEEITYKWFVQQAEYGDDGDYSYGQSERIQDADGPKLTTEPVEDRCYYFCTVTDPYGNSVRVFFEVVPEAHLSATTEGGEYGQYLHVEPNATPTLTVVASSDVGVVTYSWTVDTFSMGENGEYDWTGPVEVEGQIGSTITLPPVNSKVVYYCNVRDRFGNKAGVYFEVSVDNKIEVECVNGSSEVYVAKGSTATLQVSVTNARNLPLQYCWYHEIRITDEDGDIATSYARISGANGTSCTTEPVEGPGRYVFIAQDIYGNSASIAFDVCIENHFVAEAEQENVYVAPGEEATLRVIASCDDDSQTYQWYVEEEEEDEEGYTYTAYNMIEGETSDTYTVDSVTNRCNYACAVSDSQGNNRWVYFTVSIDAELFVEHVTNRRITLKAGEELELEVHAESSVETAAIEYQWRYSSTDEEIEGATGAKYTTEQPRTDGYVCVVTDGYGNEEYCYFDVTVDNELTVSRVGSIKVPVDEDGSATLAVTATCLMGDLTYEWRDDDYNTVEGETDNTLELTGVEYCGDYSCFVEDDYGNSRYISFDVVVNGFSVKRVGPMDVWVKKNDSVSLEVMARCDDGDLEYTWYRSEEDDDDEGGWRDIEIEGASGPILKLDNVTRSEDYYCRVRDTHGNEGYASFSISIKHDLSVNRVSPETQLARLGEQVTFEASVDSPHDNLQMQWYYNNADDDTIKIEGATDTTYSFTVTEDSPKYYSFEVYDPEEEYGDEVSFTLFRFGDISELELDVQTEALIEHNGQSVLFSFTPSETGTYTIVSKAKGSQRDTCVTLYNSDREELAYNDDGPKDVNFSLTYTLEAGETYYYLVSWLSYENTGSFPVVISEGGSVEPVQQPTLTLVANTPTVRTGDDLELTIEKSGYFWNVELVLVDENGDEYVLYGWIEPDYDMVYCGAFDEPQELTLYARGMRNGEEYLSEQVTVQVTAENGELAKPTLKIAPDGDGVKLDYTMPEHATNMRIRAYVDGKLYDRWTTTSGSWVIPIPQLSDSDMVIVSAEANASAVGYAPSTAVADTIIGGEPTDVLTLPTGLKEIGEEAFVDTAAEVIVVPEGCMSIGKRAFADCDGLRMVYLPDSVESIAGDAFSGSGRVTFYCASDGIAAEFARANGIPYVIQ